MTETKRRVVALIVAATVATAGAIAASATVVTSDAHGITLTPNEDVDE